MEALSRKLEFDKKGQMVFTFGDNWSLSVSIKVMEPARGYLKLHLWLMTRFNMLRELALSSITCVDG